ncbi:MAG: Tad domain-containing protein [Acidobacteria bacterium]|nr:Tad domain-containing protein [Acidobacteriota bacterium]
MRATQRDRKVRRAQEKGMLLLTVAVSMLLLVGFLGLSIDVGRAVVTKSETQTFADSAALAATMELDGTMAGLDRARAQAQANVNRWMLETQTFSSIGVSFGTSPNGPWETNPLTGLGYAYSRVSVSAPLPLLFMPYVMGSSGGVVQGPTAMLIVGAPSMNVRAESAGGQVPVTVFREGLFPFSPYAHNSTGPHYGLTPGQRYTLRWAANPRVGQNTCPGDDSAEMIALNDRGGGSERGYIESTSANLIRQTIVDDLQTVELGIGGQVTMTGGAKQSMLDAIITRVRQDADTSSQNYSTYALARRGTGRRLVAAPINTGYPNYTVVQIGAFFLLAESEYNKGGNNPICAEYAGAWLKGAKQKGASEAGAWEVRLVQ